MHLLVIQRCPRTFFFFNQNFPGDSDSKESACNAGDLGSNLVLGRSPGGGAWQPTPVFLSEESPQTEEPGGLYSPWGPKELNTTEVTKHTLMSLG